MKPSLCLLPILAVLAPAGHAEVFRAVFDRRIEALIWMDSGTGGDRGEIVYRQGGMEGLDLIGHTDAEGRFRWEERRIGAGPEPRPSGLFNGRFEDEGRSAGGTWSSPGGQIQRPFRLTRLARSRRLEAPAVEAEVAYPEFDPPHYHAVNQRLEAFARRRLAEQVAALEKQHRELAVRGSAATEHLTQASDCSVEEATGAAVSVLCHHYEFSGGAHGNSHFTALNFALADDGTVQSLGLWDLLAKSRTNAEQLSRLILADLRRQRASSVLEGGIKSFTAELERDSIPFTLQPGGLAFHFAPYAVGAYAEGDYEVRIDHKSLLPLLRPGSRLVR